MPDATTDAVRPATRRIGEIEGLRGLALTLVVAFHLFGNGRVSGGVDVFLFVSGFLLTASLLRWQRSGTAPRLVARYGRMLLRLTPAALLVLVATAVMVYALLPRSTWEGNGREIIASALYFENWELIASQLSYGAAGPLTSPLQHFWSLSIQGQFFFIWPLIITAVVLLARRARFSASRSIVIFVSLTTAASFGYAMLRNASEPDVAYFDSFARFWELGAGAALALISVRELKLPTTVRTALGWAGIVLIVASGFLVDGARAFPGPLALLPVFGAGLIILTSGPSTRYGADRLLALRPMRFLARISYPLYLWHWPLLIGYLSIRGYDRVGVIGGVAVFAVALGLAWATQRFLVEPILPRRGRMRVRNTIVVPLTALAVVVTLTGGGVATQYIRSQEQQTALAAITTSAPDCLGAAAMDPDRAPCTNPDLDGVLIPSPDAILDDDDNRPECWATETDGSFNLCSVGPEAGYERHLLAVGDSHNNTFVGAYQRIAEELNWRIDITGHAFCYWTAAEQPVRSPAGADACASWKEGLSEQVQASAELDGIIVTHSRVSPVTVDAGADREQVVIEGMVAAWESRPNLDVPIIAIIDNPRYPAETLACVERWGLDSAAECPVPRTDALEADDGHRAAAERATNAHIVDLTDFYCTESECPPVVGNAVVAGGWSHLTGTYAKTLAPYLARGVDAVLEGR